MATSRRAHPSLKGVEIPALRSASMIDEYPILAVVAAFAKGETRMVGIGELRHKETDRIEMMAQGLIRSGVSVTTGHDSMTVSGGGQPRGGITIDAGHDHRIAMTFLILGSCGGRTNYGGGSRDDRDKVFRSLLKKWEI